MINIALMTEYSFRKCFLTIKDIHKYVVNGVVGVADYDNTFAHIPLSVEAKKHGFKPIYGVRLRVTKNMKLRTGQVYSTFIAMNDEGMKELYGLVKKAYDNFFYFPRLSEDDVNGLRNVWTVNFPENNFPSTQDRKVYELMAGARKDGRGGGYIYKFEHKVKPQHIMTKSEALINGWSHFDMEIWKSVAEDSTATIQKAEMVKFKGSKKIEDFCQEGAKRLGIDLTKEPYAERYKREIDLIYEKGYPDYFLIVADVINFAKRTMLVGPSRGSSAGSLVCYLMSITEIDPLKYDLLFERFIDINRFDLPDIDIDFPDIHRQDVIKYLTRRYGSNNVQALANVNRFKARSAIGEFAMALNIPKYETDAVKNAIIERSSGDARVAMCIMDTFNDTLPGKEFIENYPAMRLVSNIENHASHAGKHAAGIIVSSKPLINFGGVDTRAEIIMLDKRDAEEIELLKIDCLGLVTLSILQDAAKLAKFPYKKYYDLPLDDKKTFKLLNDNRVSGVFQFEGEALKMLTRSIEVTCFDDIVAITALARPGALRSGGAAKYTKCKTGESEPKYFCKKHEEITKDTYGVMVYQEQMMRIVREIGDFTWMEVSTLRKAASKSMGDDYFSKFQKKFIEQAMEHSNLDEETAGDIWKEISHAGSWIFNKSHAVSYGLMSYLSAYMKANYPLEFAAANLTHARDDEHALKLLRDMYENDGIEYVPIDPDHSKIGWSICDGKLIGSLTNLKGIGVSKAKKIISVRNGNGKLTPALYKALCNPVTAFDVLFPTQEKYGMLFNDPKSHGLYTKPTLIRDVDEPGKYIVIGKLLNRNQRDLNEYNTRMKRGGDYIEENNLYLNIILEDDTDSIMCSIDRYNYDRLGGRKIAEEAKIGESWYLVMGKIKGAWRGISVNEIVDLGEVYGNTTAN